MKHFWPFIVRTLSFGVAAYMCYDGCLGRPLVFYGGLIVVSLGYTVATIMQSEAK